MYMSSYLSDFNSNFSNGVGNTDGNMIAIKFIGILFVMIMAMIYIAKTTFFNMAFKPKEDGDYTYQKIAAAALFMLAFFYYFTESVF